MIEQLRYKFGKKCSLVNINGEISKINIPSKHMKFCEAISSSFKIPIQINKKNLQCPGARRSLGFEKEEKTLINEIVKNSGISSEFLSDALSEIPCFNDQIKWVNIGITVEMEAFLVPDLVILYLNPSDLTELLHSFARNSIKPHISPYALLSVCGNVFADCYLNQHISISFGCPESRKHGGIMNEELIVGIPFKYGELLLN